MASRNAHGTSVVGGQRQAIERLKATLFGSDPYVRSKYIGDFHREFRSFRGTLTREELLAACSCADVVFVGDYHALPSCQSFAAGLLEELSRQPRPLVLFLEMVFARDQRILDQYLAGGIGAEELRRRIRYDRDWGYPWEGYERLLAAARGAGVDVVAADAPPRGGLRMIRRRDRHAACKVCERLQSEPGSRALVLFGESHMASGHLPREVRRTLKLQGLRKRSIVIVQNVEAIHWKLAREGLEGADAVMIDEDRYAVFNASPLAKYEAYRQTLLRWAQQEDEAPDFGPSIHHLIDMLAGYLGLDPYETATLSQGGISVPLVDLYPEVATRRDRRRRRHAPRKRRGPRPGIVYRPVPNRIDVYTFSLAAAGDAASRFLLTAVRGRAGRAASVEAPYGMPGPGEGSGRALRPAPRRADRGRGLPFASVILDEAFVAFSVRYLDPGVPFAEMGSGRARSAGRDAPRDRDGRQGRQDLVDAASGASRGAAKKPSPRSQEIARLGERLGESIYARLRKGSRDRTVRSWLLEVARLKEGSAGHASRAEELLRQGASAAGWSRS